MHKTTEMKMKKHTDKLTAAYMKVIMEQAAANAMTFEATFYESGNQVGDDKTYASFGELKDAIAEFFGMTFDDLSKEIYKMGADVSADMSNYDIDESEPDAYERYFAACLEADDTSLILVHDYSEDDGEWDAEGAKAVVFSYDFA